MFFGIFFFELFIILNPLLLLFEPVLVSFFGKIRIGLSQERDERLLFYFSALFIAKFEPLIVLKTIVFVAPFRQGYLSKFLFYKNRIY